MANGDVYALDDGKNLFPTMTKEQIISAIIEAINEGTISDVDAGFITKIKEINHNANLQFWTGTQAEYNALLEKDHESIEYRITDDTTMQDFEQRIIDVEDDLSKIINGDLTVAKSSQSDNATNADHAVEADFATFAEIATYATNAQNASEAEYAMSAGFAESATNAYNADNASNAVHANSATTVENLYLHFITISGSTGTYEFQIYITLTTQNNSSITKSSLLSLIDSRSVAASGYVIGKNAAGDKYYPVSKISGSGGGLGIEIEYISSTTANISNVSVQGDYLTVGDGVVSL